MQQNVFRKPEGKKSTREPCLLRAVLVSVARTNYEDQQGAVFETCCLWRWALISGNIQIHAQIPVPCLFLVWPPFCGSLSVWEIAQRYNRVWQEKVPTCKEKTARDRVIGWIRVLLTTCHRKFTSPKKSQLLGRAVVLQWSPGHVTKPSTWFENCSPLFPLMIQRYERSTDLEWCQTVSTALSFEDWEYDKGLYKAKGLCRLVCPSFKPYLTLAEMKKQGRTEM